jgi:hypothetical protein
VIDLPTFSTCIPNRTGDIPAGQGCRANQPAPDRLLIGTACGSEGLRHCLLERGT